MGTTYLKRQKEMKRLEKQREKAERRAQKKLANRAQTKHQAEDLISNENAVEGADLTTPGADNISRDYHENSPDPDETPLE